MSHAVTVILAAFVMVIAISYGFELFSFFSGLGLYDVYDAIASIIGGVVDIATATLADYKFHF